jgi:hypothetical protein
MRFAVVLLAACSSAPAVTLDAATEGDAAADAATTAVRDSCATQTVLTAHDSSRSQTLLFDLTGDAQPDPVQILTSAPQQYRLAIGDPVAAQVTLTGASAFLASVGAADVNVDGQRDLVVGLLWERRAFVILGPLTGDLDDGDAFVSIAGPPANGGLEPLFGAAVLVGDVNLDGARDVVVTAPAEREESCEGQLPPRVHLGPFIAGEQRDEDDVDVLLAGPLSACLGEELACTDAGLRASVDQGAVCYTYPLTTDEPTACP